MTSTPSPADNYWIDKIDDPFAKGLTGTLWDLGKRFIGTSFDYFRDKKQVATAAKQYADKYRSRYGKIRLLGMSEDIDLESVYTAVKFLDKLSIQMRFGSMDVIESGYRNSGKRKFQTGESKPVKGSEVANSHQYLYILANPGAGKSTFLRRVGLEAIKGKEGKYQHSMIPVMLELKQFNQGEVNLIAAITEELSYFGFPDKDIVAKTLLTQGKLLLLLDGLDEVPNEYRDEVQNKIGNLLTQYSDNRFILSCRIAAYKSVMTNFTTVELADFDDEQIARFIGYWFNSEPEIGDDCWNKLSQPESKASKELAQTPLLLTFLCLVYEQDYDFPKQRSRLYLEALEILLKKWDTQRRIRRDKIHQDWNIDLEKTLLAEIAYDYFEKNQLFFQKSEIIEYIKVFLADTVDNPKYLDGESILEAIAIQQGIFVERATGVYSFSHLTLQEYLTAQHISDDNKLIEELVTEHLTDERWKEVFLLVAGIKNNADQLLELIEAATRKLINTPKLNKLLTWIKRVSNPNNSNFTSLGKRVLCIGHAYAYAHAHTNNITMTTTNAAYTFFDPKVDANAITIANAYVYDISQAYNFCKVDYIALGKPIQQFFKYARWSEKWQIYQDINYAELIEQLEILKTQIPDKNKNESTEVKQPFANHLLQTWFAAFHTTPEAMTLSREEIKTLDQYLYANYLIIQCKDAAVRVSATTWNKIESRMLLPVD